MNRKVWMLLLYAGTALLALLGLQNWLREASVRELVSYDQLERSLVDGRIESLVVSDQWLVGRLRQPQGRITELVAARVEPALAERLDRYGVSYSRMIESTLWREVISWILPLLIFVVLWFFLIRRGLERPGGHALMPIGSGKARVAVTRETGVKFA
ncbi:MAG: cell division protein FtsH, partial [Limnohabitans sp.]